MAKAMLTETTPTAAPIVPLHFAEFCGIRNPRSNNPCRRARGHQKRHAFIWRFCVPGMVREVWTSDCQVCHRPTTDGAVCRECGT